MKPFAIAVFVMAAWAACAAAQQPQLALVCDPWPPYQYQSEGQARGFSVELIREAMRRTGASIERITFYPWKRAMLVAMRGEADGLFSANRTPGRTDYFFYPQHSLIDTPWLVWTRADSELRYRGLEDLAGRTVGVVRGYSYTPEFWRFVRDRAEVVEVTSDEQLLRLLTTERVDAVVAERSNAVRIIHEFALAGLRAHAEHPIKSVGLYIAFTRGNVPGEFVTRFSQVLGELKRTDWYAALRRRHFGHHRSKLH